MPFTREHARELLHRGALRCTAPRVAVAVLLANHPGPLSHSEVLERLGDTDWDPATIYRNLVRLAEAGIARVVSRAGGMARYELAVEGAVPAPAHPHFVCTDCGTVACLPEKVKIRVSGSGRWRKAVEEATAQLCGRCPECRAEADR